MRLRDHADPDLRYADGAAAAPSAPAAAEGAPEPAMAGISGTWQGRWGGRTIRLRLAQFDSLVVGDLSIEGLQLRITGGIDEVGTLAFASAGGADANVSYRTGSSGWRLQQPPHPRLPVLCGGLQRRSVAASPRQAPPQESVVQFEARLTPEAGHGDRD